MKVSLNHILVVDVESTCWDGPPEGNRDIIEIGIVELHMENLKIYKWDKIFVFTDQKPSSYCTELTGITGDLLRYDGINYGVACAKIISQYHGLNRLWVSWGEYDKLQFIENSQRRKGIYPFSSSHINLKQLFSIMMGFTKGLSLDKALKFAGMEFEGKRHSALDDALNTAKLFTWLVGNNKFLFNKGA